MNLRQQQTKQQYHNASPSMMKQGGRGVAPTQLGMLGHNFANQQQHDSGPGGLAEGFHSQDGSSGNNQAGFKQFNQIRLQSEVLELIQTLSLDYDQMSPVEVRQKLRSVVQAEQEARNKREAYLGEILQQRMLEEQVRYQDQFDKLRFTFEHETTKFEKTLKDRAQGIIKSLQMKHLDQLINLVGRIRQIHNIHGSDNQYNVNQNEPCHQTQSDLQNLISYVDKLMAELSSDDGMSHVLSEPNNFASQDELARKIGSTPFNPNLKDQILFLQQQSSNGVVANNNRQNQADVPANAIGQMKPAEATRFGAATSYGNVTSGEGLPITSGSNILSPNTTPSQDFINNHQAEATLSNPQIHRSNTAANQFPKAGGFGGGQPRFVYDLPPDFPFNEASIGKSLSNDFANNSAFKSGSHGNGTNSQNTASNHDVNPEDVLRTFTNSLHSGGTLGAIHSSLTYYKEQLLSKEWSNLSPSNAYQNFMWQKNLVGEIQKLAKEISRIPTEEAKIKLADLSKSHLSHEGSRRFVNNSNQILHGPSGNKMGMQIPPGMTTAEAISKGLGFIGNNESSILMDLNRASIVAAQKEAEEIQQKAKRIVDDSATRLEPVMKNFADAPITQQLLQAQNPGGSNQNQGFIEYQQQPTSSLPDSQGLFPDRQHQQSDSQNNFQQIMHGTNHNESMMRDSCVKYDEGDQETHQKQKQQYYYHPDGQKIPKKSPVKQYQKQGGIPQLNYHASNERSQLSEEDSDGITDEVLMHQHKQTPSSQHNHQQQRVTNNLVAQAVQNKIGSSHRRHGSVVVGEHTIQNRIETQPHQQNNKNNENGREQLSVYAERRSIQHERDELSPKQLRNESLSVQRSSIAAKRKVQHMGFFSNDVPQTFNDMELEQIEQAQNFQQTTSFAPQNKTPWWLDDVNELNQNQVLFQQTAGPNMQGRNALQNKLQSSRRRGTQSVNSQYANFASQNLGSQGNNNSLNNTRFGDQNLSNNVLDNKGRAINKQQNQEQTSGNLYDELSRVAEYQSSRSVLDGYSAKAHRNQQTNLNRTMQAKKKSVTRESNNQNQQQQNSRDNQKIADSSQQYLQASNVAGTRENISKSVLTNNGADSRASPVPSSLLGVGVLGPNAKVPKMNIKKTQIKLVGGIQNKRSSIQVAGASSSTGQQSKSVSREGRLKVKLVQKGTGGVPTPIGGKNISQQSGQTTTDPNISRFSSVNNGGLGSVNTSQSPKMSRNTNQRVVLATGPSKSSQGHNIPTGIMENQRQREFSPQHQQQPTNLAMVQGLQQPSQGAYVNKIPFKSVNKREEANISGPQVRNNFFSENTGTNQQQDDDTGKRQIANISQLSAPIGGTVHQPLKIRRNRKQAKRVVTPTIEENLDDDNQQQLNTVQKVKHNDSQDRETDEQCFNDIATNLRQKQDQAAAGIFIRKGSHHHHNQQNQSQQNQQAANHNNSYGTGSSVQQSRDLSAGAVALGESTGGKSRQVGGQIVRTFKTHKSRQAEELERPFGTERVSFHKSALMSNQATNRKNTNMTHQENNNQGASNGNQHQSVPAGYKRPAGSINKNLNTNAVTVRVQSHSQPPLGQTPQQQQYAAATIHDNNLNEPQIIPPPTEALMTDEQCQETSSTPGQMSGNGSALVNTKRPVVKMTAINFIGGQQQQTQQSQHVPQVSNFATVQNQQQRRHPNAEVGGSGEFSFHHPPSQPSQGQSKKKIKHSKKSSIIELEASPYMTTQNQKQGGISGGPSGGPHHNTSSTAANKRIIHLKRPSTNFQMASSNQPNLISGSKAFAQRAASRVEHIDRQNELSFQSNGKNGQASDISVISAIQRPTTQIRIGKKTSVGGTQQAQVVIGASRTNGNYMRPASDLSNGEGEYASYK